MSDEEPMFRAARLDAQASVILAKLNAPGRESVFLGMESAELVEWMKQRGWVAVENLGGTHFVLRLVHRPPLKLK